MKSLLGTFALLGASLFLCLLLAEGALRVLADPVDFLRPRRVEDPILGHRVQPGSAGHDRWGFRNQAVPESAEIVAIGDSTTYGVGASARNSWPSWLARLSGRSVYNMGMGAYGPPDYWHLLEKKAFSLRPSLVIVGFYLGNDLINAFDRVCLVDHWRALRDTSLCEGREEASKRSTAAGVAPAQIVAHGRALGTRRWLSENSVLYNMARYGLADRLRDLEITHFYESNIPFTLIRDEEGGLVSALNPVTRFLALDLEDANIRDGMRLSFAALDGIAKRTSREGADFLVLLIPTKISAFAGYRPDARPAENRELIARLVANEVIAREHFEEWLDARGIAHVSALPDLRARAGVDPVFGKALDGHPAAAGYRVIAEAALRRIRAGL